MNNIKNSFFRDRRPFLKKIDNLWNNAFSEELAISKLPYDDVELSKDDEQALENDKFYKDKELDLVYVRDGDNRRILYHYMKNYDIDRYDRYPRLHLIYCSTRKDFAESKYWGTTTEENDVINRNTREKTRKSLEICQNCRDEVYNKIVENGIDFYGYTFGKGTSWKEITRNYRAKMNFTCEKCGLDKINSPSKDTRYLHTHHKNGNKLDNNENNLQCLCILCHANIDKHHKEKFMRSLQLKEMEEFKSKYRKELLACGNRYV